MTGIHGLDEILRGGILSTVLAAGTCGSGKTTSDGIPGRGALAGEACAHFYGHGTSVKLSKTSANTLSLI